ncbi:signal peptidase II [Leucobacter triazinivorans]|uniref:signal peptidase II n=1 Tax=Leucobacter triazinivorans TaxID=1784719 RepID=UPI001F10E7E5|nr:signal peptidase II [Leucobacter triazinivorans]
MNDASEAVDASVTSRRRLVPLLLIGVAAVVFSADQLVKNWVVATLPEGRTVPVLGEFLQWHFVRNPGAAFSMASGATWIFTILAAAVVVVILWQIRRLRSVSWALFLGLLLGGVLGNLTDRLTREPGFPEGHVIDFILTPWMWLGFTPAIYNIADMGIVVGMLLFIVISLIGLPIDGSPRARRGDVDVDGEPTPTPTPTGAAESAEVEETAEPSERKQDRDRDDGAA